MKTPGPPEKPERERGQGVGPTPTEKWATRASGEAERGRGGRPKGSRDKNPRKRRGAPELEVNAEPAAPPEPPTDAEILGVGKMLGVSWRILGGRFKRRPLAPDEERELAEAAIPVLAKYGGGFLEQWGAEISLGIVAIGMWDRTRLPENTTTSSAAVLEQDDAA